VAGVPLVIGGLLAGVIIGIAAYGWVTLPADARVPVHHGIGSYNRFLSKTAGLIVWAGVGLLLFGLQIAVSQYAIKPNHSGSSPALIIIPIVLAIAVPFEWGAIAVARRNALGQP